ncbi:MAG: VWA domain-containing protein [Hellea sp.]
MERIVPAGTRKEVAVRTEVSPQRFYLRNDAGEIIREFASRDAFEIYQANLTTSVEETPVSTFSIDVDTASYSFFRSSINRGQLPPRSSIRLEEMINYFPYDYAAPRSADEPFKANVTVTPTPWNKDTKLMHIGIKGFVPAMDERPRSNIVFLIDTSGSMNQANKLPLLISSFKLLLGTLDEDDTVSIVTYAGRAGTVLEPTPASDTQKIDEALTRLRAGGSTAGAAGLELAYNKAQESFDEDGNNRVILATDGDFNVGFSSHEEMKTFIEEKRETGIFLSVLGFGRGNYNDQLMQALAQNGNGVAAYIDNLAEANKVLANEAGSALLTIAKDVKIQVEFNPETIAEYRLIGYETRALKREDFNNDKVDAGEINAGHSVTAIYEMTPVGSPAISNDPLRYIEDKVRSKTTGSDEFAFVKIRHKLPKSDTSTLRTFPIGKAQERSLNRASDDMRFATAVAAVGQKLRGDTPLEDFSYADAIELASGAKGEDKNGYRSEFIQLVRLAEGLAE